MRNEQTQMKEAGGKKQHLVLIRVTAALAVVILHTFHTASAMKLLPEKSLPAANMIRALCFFAVPCFVMVTGALLLSPQRTLTYGKLFKRYILENRYLLLMSVSDGNSAVSVHYLCNFLFTISCSQSGANIFILSVNIQHSLIDGFVHLKSAHILIIT